MPIDTVLRDLAPDFFESRGWPMSDYLDALTTKKKESLIYLADHVGPNVIEKEVQKLIQKYRKKLDKKASVA